MLTIKGGGLEVISTLPTSFLIGTEFAPLYVFILAFFFLGAGIFTSADFWQRAYAGSSPKSVRWAMGTSSILIFLFLAMAIIFGIYGKVLLPNTDPNIVVPELLKVTLPNGIFGIVLAGFFAAIMSTADSALLIVSMTLVHDLYHKTFNKKLSSENLLKMSRWVTFIVGLIALTIALTVFNLVQITIEALGFYVVLVPAIAFGFYWKKATSKAAFWSIILGLLSIVAFLFIDPVQAFIPGIVVSFIAFLVVNYFVTRPLLSSSRVEKF
jgi:SSS family solute:Na+ symporter